MKIKLPRLIEIHDEIMNFLIWFRFWIVQTGNSSLKETGSNKGDRVVLVCNGPSAKEFPYEVYKKQDYSFCCVNYFALDEQMFFSLKPKYYCIVDPVFAKAEYQKTEKCQKLFQILEAIDWDINIITHKDRVLPLKNKHIHYRFINRVAYNGELNWFKTMLFRHNLACCGIQNVSVAAIYYFIISGVEQIILTGVENDWHRELIVDEQNKVYRELTHFYGNERVCVTDLGQIGMGELYRYFQFYMVTLKQHRILARFAKIEKVDIVNTCLNSYIDNYSKRPALLCEEACINETKKND